MWKFSVLLICCAVLTGAHAQNARMHLVDPVVLAKLKRDGEASVCVLLKQQADLSAAQALKTKGEKGRFVYETMSALARESQAGVRQLLQSEGRPFRAYWLVNTVFCRADLALLEKLTALPEVAAVLENGPITYAEPVAMSAIEGEISERAITWGLSMINADEVWALGYRGQGVVISGQDTGYDWTHPAINPRYRGLTGGASAVHDYNWHDAIHAADDPDGGNPCGYDTQQPCDDGSHGTHTMGTMVGLDGDHIIGVAPEAQWIAARNMNQGNGTLQTYVECFEWFVAPTDLSGNNPNPDMAPHVMNNSWYCSTGEGCNESNFEVMRQAVAATRAAGIVPVVSVGNQGPNCSSAIGPPGFFEESFSVGATNDLDSIAGFSSRGPVTIDGSNRRKPNVCAPGVGIESSVPGGAYASYNGTSMSGPHVAGLVALVISAAPSLAGNVDLIEDIIENTCVPISDMSECGGTAGQVPNNVYGFGRVDALGAVQLAIATVGTGSVMNNDPTVVVMPNPFQDRLNLAVRGLSGDVSFRLFDMSGRLLTEERFTVQNTDILPVYTGWLTDGMYFYEVTNAGKQFSGKLLKQQ